MDRDEAYRLLTEYTKKEGLIKHALAVEAAMREYAERFKKDQETWGIVGLLHDFDYEKYPDAENHPFKGVEILREKRVPEEWITAILGHADYSGVKRESAMAKALFGVDELTGFIVAVALVRPNKKIADVEVKSVKKKMKDKAFAKAVNRDELTSSMEALDVEFNDHIDTIVSGLIEHEAFLNESGQTMLG